MHLHSINTCNRTQIKGDLRLNMTGMKFDLNFNTFHNFRETKKNEFQHVIFMMTVCRLVIDQLYKQ